MTCTQAVLLKTKAADGTYQAQGDHLVIPLKQQEDIKQTFLSRWYCNLRGIQSHHSIVRSCKYLNCKCCFGIFIWYLCNLIKTHWNTARAMFTTPHSSVLLHHAMASCPPPQLSSARMLLAKHRQLQPVNCLISHQSIYPNKERWRSGTKVVERMGGTQWGVRINERATVRVKRTKSRLQPEFPAPPGLCVSVCVRLLVHVSDILLTIKKGYWSKTTHRKQKGVWTGGRNPPTTFSFVCHGFVCVCVCIYMWLSVPYGQLNRNILEMRNIWSLLIGQFLLPTYVAFFSFQKPMKRKNTSYLFSHAYCSTECCTNCHCPSAKRKSSPSVPWINSTITQNPCSVYRTVLLEPVRETHTSWCQDYSGFVFLWESLFCQAGNGPCRDTWLDEAAVRNVPEQLLSFSCRPYLCIILASLPPLNLLMWSGWGREVCNHLYLGSYCSTHFMCNPPNPRR